jgi:hypothetical protein
MQHFLAWLTGTHCSRYRVKALLMVISPQAWFHLPSWIPGKGSLTGKKYGTGKGRDPGAGYRGNPAWSDFVGVPGHTHAALTTPA